MRVSKRILLGLGILLFALEIQAQVTLLLRRPTAAAAVISLCTNLQQQYTNLTANGNLDIASIGGRRHAASRFIASNSVTVCSLEIYIHKVGSPTQTVWCSIWNTNGVNMPTNTLNTNWSSSIEAEDLPAGTNWISFSNLNHVITAGNHYYIVLKSDTNNSSNYPQLAYHSGQNNTNGCLNDADGLDNWTVIGNTGTIKYKVYSQ